MRCFAGNSSCSSYQADAGGSFGSCAPDGFCNLFDANHALRAFAGTNPCFCPEDGSRGAPAQSPGPSQAAHLTLAADRMRVRPGGEVRVRVLIDEPLTDLQSYQLHLEASGGRSGHLDLIDISIADGADGVFANKDLGYDAANLSKGQMLQGLDGGGVATHAKARLATYTYRVSSDAAGTFVVDVLHDESKDHQSFLVSRFTERIDITGTAPAVVEVSR